MDYIAFMLAQLTYINSWSDESTTLDFILTQDNSWSQRSNYQVHTHTHAQATKTLSMDFDLPDQYDTRYIWLQME